MHSAAKAAKIGGSETSSSEEDTDKTKDKNTGNDSGAEVTDEEEPKVAGKEKQDPPVHVRIPQKSELKQKERYTKLKRMSEDHDNGPYWAENKDAYRRFMVDSYLTRRQGWDPINRGRLEFLSNPKKIAKIIADINCTPEEYIRYFELDNTTRDQILHSNYAPFWYLAYGASKDPETSFYKRLWIATYGHDPSLYFEQDYLIRIHPAGIEKYIYDEARYGKEPDAKTLLRMIWDSIDEYERRFASGSLDDDPDFL
ncbi:hypothetical protein BJ508DRAFT_361524 [Ascobolus immersus RN42]|uniref:Uncharacterized protein n=1 Tax=Ascobolus immersus RN42 TaxID=1160509 RepID=A0A3N4ICP3_ASCIM|nr:hypothetical protein BJ508DRAFT_361524 [Ascobolus immersus RN42]